MKRSEIQELAVQALAAAKFTTASGHARTNCPFCEFKVGKEDKKQCLGIHTVTGWFRCWRCATVGRIDGMEDLPETDAPLERKPPPEPPPGFYSMAQLRNSMGAEDAREYLQSRGLAESIWYEAGLGACLTGKYANRVVIPVKAPEGQWLGWVSRVWTKKAPDAYRNAPGMALGEILYNHAALLVETDHPVLVVEGAFDALAYWPHAVAVLGKPGEAQVYALAAAKRPVVIALDGDAWTEGEALAMRLRMDGVNAGSVRLPPCIDPDEVPPEVLWAAARGSLETVEAFDTEWRLKG